MRLSVNELWTDALAIARQHREILIAIGGFFFVLPALLLTVLAPFESDATELAAFARDAQIYVRDHFWALFLVTLVTSLGQLAVLLLFLGGRRMAVGEAMRAALARLPLFVGLVVLVNLMLVGGALLFILPAFYLYGRTMLAGPVYAAEGVGPLASITRSFALTRGSAWRLVGVAALIAVAGWIVGAASAAVVGSAAAIVGGRELAHFFGALVNGIFGAITSMLALLVGVAAYRQATRGSAQ